MKTWGEKCATTWRSLSGCQLRASRWTVGFRVCRVSFTLKKVILGIEITANCVSVTCTKSNQRDELTNPHLCQQADVSQMFTAHTQTLKMFSLFHRRSVLSYIYFKAFFRSYVLTVFWIPGYLKKFESYLTLKPPYGALRLPQGCGNRKTRTWDHKDIRKLLCKFSFRREIHFYLNVTSITIFLSFTCQHQ